MPWFAVRCVFHSPEFGAYEERITIWEASDVEAAVALAEVEAAENAEACDLTALAFAQSFQMFDRPGQGAEIFSLFRTSSLDADDYLDRFFDTGAERQGKLD